MTANLEKERKRLYKQINAICETGVVAPDFASACECVEDLKTKDRLLYEDVILAIERRKTIDEIRKALDLIDLVQDILGGLHSPKFFKKR